MTILEKVTSVSLGMPLVPSSLDPSRPDPSRPDDPRLVDRYGRVATDLRVSLTDRCNLRCTYCMPPRAWTGCPPRRC
jgi:GTP 3',8-cyclase